MPTTGASSQIFANGIGCTEITSCTVIGQYRKGATWIAWETILTGTTWKTSAISLPATLLNYGANEAIANIGSGTYRVFGSAQYHSKATPFTFVTS